MELSGCHMDVFYQQQCHNAFRVVLPVQSIQATTILCPLIGGWLNLHMSKFSGIGCGHMECDHLLHWFTGMDRFLGCGPMT